MTMVLLEGGLAISRAWLKTLLDKGWFSDSDRPVNEHLPVETLINVVQPHVLNCIFSAPFWILSFGHIFTFTCSDSYIFSPLFWISYFQPNASGEWGEPWGPAAAAGEPQEGPAGVPWQGDNIFIEKAILVHKYISQTQQLESPDKVRTYSIDRRVSLQASKSL